MCFCTMLAFKITQPVPAGGAAGHLDPRPPLWCAFGDHNRALTHKLCFFFIYDLEGSGMLFSLSPSLFFFL